MIRMSGPCCRIFWLAAFAIILSVALPGCSKERMYQNVYEGVRMKDGADRQPADPERMPSYEEYQRDRQNVIKDNVTE